MIKPQGESIGENRSDHGFGNVFLNRTQKPQAIKGKHGIVVHQIKAFCISKDTQFKTQATKLGTIFCKTSIHHRRTRN